MLLFAFGEMLENMARRSRPRGHPGVGGSHPPNGASRRQGGGVEEVAADRLAVGDMVQVRPGDRVPCDGEIVEGTSALDESPVTGESVPVARGSGETVLAGSVNADAGLLRIRTTRGASDNTVARIVKLVEEAAASRAPTQRFVERFAEWWTPAAMVVAIARHPGAAAAVRRRLVDLDLPRVGVLLIACPCALVISVPGRRRVRPLCGRASAACWSKGGAALEAIGAAKTVAFDKTGTLTEGRPR